MRVQSAAFTAIMLTATTLVAAPLSTAFTYQGQLKSQGVPLNGAIDLEVSLFDVESGSVSLDVLNLNNVTVTNGLFNVELDFGAEVFNGDARWLEIAVRSPHDPGNTQSFTILTPRQPLTATPYALQTRGLFVDNAGDVGIGTTDPVNPLHVEGDGLAVVYGRHTNTVDEGAGGWFESVSPKGAGVAGFAISATGRSVGVWGQAGSDRGAGVIGVASSETGDTRGVMGICESDAGHAGYFEGRGYFRDSVGIGEKNPQALLHLSGVAGKDGLMFPDGTLQTTAAIGGGGTGSLWSESADVFNNDIFYTSGNVGIGTESNGSRLHVNTSSSDAILAETSDPSGTAVRGIATATTDGPAWGGYFTAASPLGRGVFAHTTASSGSTVGGLFLDGSSSGKGVFAQAYASSGINYGIYGQTFSPDGYAGYFRGGRNYFEGNVGIGTTTPDSALSVAGNVTVLSGTGVETVRLEAFTGGTGGGAVLVRDQLGTTTVEIEGSEGNGGGSYIKMWNSDAVQTIELDADEVNGGVIRLKNLANQTTIELLSDIGGEGRLVCDVVQIKGGSDLSEQFDVSSTYSKIEPGMVVSIDPANAGKLMVCHEAYDKKVAGIISGAGGVKPGLLMGQEGSIADGQYPVALTGRVWCRVDASFGKIFPGDLLTTSNTPGYAMKAGDADRARGAVIGKAMTPLVEGTGLVLVLVQPQ